MVRHAPVLRGSPFQWTYERCSVRTLIIINCAKCLQAGYGSERHLYFTAIHRTTTSVNDGSRLYYIVLRFLFKITSITTNILNNSARLCYVSCCKLTLSQFLCTRKRRTNQKQWAKRSSKCTIIKYWSVSAGWVGWCEIPLLYYDPGASQPVLPF